MNQGARTLVYSYDFSACDKPGEDSSEERLCAQFEKMKIGEHGFFEKEPFGDAFFGYWLKNGSQKMVSIEDYDQNKALKSPHERYAIFIPQQ